ncbi:hypothetical protein DE146DRAFT_338717 [Phaeosphaeria sp. MPI-PUGE-AT-0046c]|nr:hypothetical protein DE146DRAFT_338717 [Phaeosphaeria sp. MPI-PUGE-AT-0046c]
MADKKPFQFWGAGAGGGKTFNFAFGGQMALLPQPQQQQQHQQSVPAPLTQEQLEGALARALVQIRLLGSQLDTAVKAERIAREALNILRSAWNTSPDSANMAERELYRDEIRELKLEIKDLKSKRHEDGNEIEKWQGENVQQAEEIKKLNAALKERDAQTKAAEREHEKNISVYVRDNEQLEQQLTQSQTSAAKQEQKAAEHAKEFDFYKTRSDNLDNAFKDAIAAIDHEKKKREVVEKEKADIEQQHDTLREQHEEVQAKLAETYTFSAELEELNTVVQNLQADHERQTDLQRELERTIIVKDERIAQLEQQYQKERHRALHAEQARNDADEAAVTSPILDAPPLLSDAGDSLQFQLLEADYDEGGPDYFEEEQQSLSEITAVASPPVDPPLPKLSLNVNSGTTVAPQEAVAPKLTLNVNSGTAVAPQEAVAPKFTLNVNSGTAVAPQEAVAPKLAMSTDKEGTSVSVEPVDFRYPMLDKYIYRGVSTSPKEPKQNLTEHVLHQLTLDVAPEAPAQPEAPTLTFALIESASIAIAPTLPSPNLTITSATTIHEQSPDIAPTLREFSSVDTQTSTPSTSRATTNSTGVQTVATTTEPPTIPIVERVVQQDRKPNKLGWSFILLSIVAMLVAGYCAYLFREVNDWRTANTVAHRGSHTRGAYGNGRYLWKIIPLAMDEDDFLAKFMSRVLMKYEKPVLYY